MPDTKTIERYSPSLKILHWMMAAMMLTALCTGFLMIRIDGGSLQNSLFDLHRSLGVTILLLAPIRVAVHFLTPRPGPVPGLAPIQQLAANGVHLALYAAFFAQPIVGLIGTQAFGAPILVWSLVEVPVFFQKDEALSKLLLGLHGLGAWVLLVLIGAHIGAALHHHFIRRDGLIRRML
ncbi:cytochrome b [Lacibacterium aquatile]|uniref:Cytochrome b n=1 Tax=Lacibacterium aquatile TaxID=1168082 RepID=A0ABW5DJV4_9PROT